MQSHYVEMMIQSIFLFYIIRFEALQTTSGVISVNQFFSQFNRGNLVRNFRFLLIFSHVYTNHRAGQAFVHRKKSILEFL